MTTVPVATGRLKSGIAGLDAMIGGGFLPGDSTLVAGSPGTGKTTMGLHFLAAGVQAGEPGIFVTFEYLPQQIYRDALKKGWPIQQWEKDNRMQVVCTTPDILLADVNSKQTILDGLIGSLGAKRLVIDSMSHFEFRKPGSAALRERLAGLVNHLRLRKVTTMMTHEIAQIVGPTVTLSNYGLEFLADNLIVLRYVELDGEMQKACNVLKFRGGAHDRKYRPLQITEQGIVIQDDFAGVQDISSGTARRDIGQRVRRMV